ncbi:MAG: class I SAM-dependent methyltransferase [Solirubrobacterales bacterium]
MGRIANTWIDLGRAVRRRRRKRGETADRWGYRLDWVKRNASSRSFVDVGGLYATGRIAFAAEDAGAQGVTLFDAGDPVLTEFPQRAKERGSSVRTVQGDLEDAEAIRRAGPHDVVWCTGVIYHTPNPVLQLMHLREITKELLYMGTHTIPEVPGIPQACLFYPYLDERTRSAVIRGHGNRRQGAGLGLSFDDAPMTGHANFWWGITPSAVRAMLRAARFEIVEEAPIAEYPFMMDVVARPVETAPLLPPTSYYREREEARERGEPPPPFEDFYEKTGRGYL